MREKLINFFINLLQFNLSHTRDVICNAFNVQCVTFVIQTENHIFFLFVLKFYGLRNNFTFKSFKADSFFIYTNCCIKTIKGDVPT